MFDKQDRNPAIPDLEEQIQQHLGLSRVKPGGRLVYAVCTLTRSETAVVASGFDAAHPDFEPFPLPIASAAAGTSRITLFPQDVAANGMFIAAWRRRR